MKKIFTMFFFFSLIIFFLVSCTSMYVKPTIETTLFRQKVPGSAEMIFKTSLKLLPLIGYKIEGSDADAGTITTNPVEMKISPQDCDCGKAFGLPIVKNEGINAKVYFVLGVSDNEITIRADVEPEIRDLMATLTAAGMTVTCVSKGNLEQVFAKKFMDNMKTKALQMIF
ncbi:MAG: hypothetical protein KA120_05745 [Candidatus Goldbacteria bacterium]|nr:hypothetical protein [Candidatus Goldiibacteriota bacterium]